MQQYFIKETIQPALPVSFDSDQMHHMLRVMRFQQGSQVLVVDQNQKKYLVELVPTDATVTGRVVEEITTNSEFPFTIIVAQGIIKGDRFDLFLQKVSELGVNRIIPLKTNRTIVKIQSEKEDKKQQRWQKIAIEAAEQSRRTMFPIVDEVMTLKQLVSLPADVKLIAYEDDATDRSSFKQAIKSLKPNQTVLLVVGSEGGFDSSEVDYLSEQGFIRCGLGPRILRAETAAMYALSAISYEKELIG